GRLNCPRLRCSKYKAVMNSASPITPPPSNQPPTNAQLESGKINTHNTIAKCLDIELRPRPSRDSSGETSSSSLGNSSQDTRYSVSPTPPKMVAHTNATRTTTGSIPYRYPTPAATPA